MWTSHAWTGTYEAHLSHAYLQTKTYKHTKEASNLHSVHTFVYLIIVMGTVPVPLVCPVGGIGLTDGVGGEVFLVHTRALELNACSSVNPDLAVITIEYFSCFPENWR